MREHRLRATPHARGSTPVFVDDAPPPTGHPARTGVYLPLPPPRRPRAGPPRTHGGSTRQAAPPLHRGDSHPARTGVYRVFTRRLSAAPGPPRTHGGLPTSLRVSTASWGTTPHAQESACAISCASTWVSGPPRTLAGPVRPDALTHVETHAPRITRPPRADRGPPDTKAVQTHRRRGHPARTGVNQIPLRPPRTDGGLPTRTFLHQRRPEATPHARGSTTKWVRVPINIAERPARTRVYRGGRNEMRKFGPPRTHGGLLASRSAARRTQTATPDARGVYRGRHPSGTPADRTHAESDRRPRRSPRTHGAANVEPCHGDDHTSQESRPHLRPPHQPHGSVARQIHGDHPRLNGKPSPASVAGSLDTQCHIIDRGHPARTGVYPAPTFTRIRPRWQPRTHGGLPLRRKSFIAQSWATPHARGSTV